MPQSPWTRLTREQSQQVLKQLGDRRDAVVFSKEVTEVSYRALPFYTHHKLYRLVNYATMPTFTMHYLTNGIDYISIDGTANPIYTVNEKDPVHLDEMNVIAYLEFFFSNVQGSEGDVFLIRDPRKMPFMDSLSPSQQQSVISSFKPLKIFSEPEQGMLKVTGTIYYGGGLIAATILVSSDGKISFQDQSLLLSGIYFPDSPYTQSWLEGQG
jgi:hypothetical protein